MIQGFPIKYTHYTCHHSVALDTIGLLSSRSGLLPWIGKPYSWSYAISLTDPSVTLKDSATFLSSAFISLQHLSSSPTPPLQAPRSLAQCLQTFQTGNSLLVSFLASVLLQYHFICPCALGVISQNTMKLHLSETFEPLSHTPLLVALVWISPVAGPKCKEHQAMGNWYRDREGRVTELNLSGTLWRKCYKTPIAVVLLEEEGCWGTYMSTPINRLPGEAHVPGHFCSALNGQSELVEIQQSPWAQLEVGTGA